MQIPVSAQNPSLNLGQAAVVVCYEWFKLSDCRHPERSTSAAEGSQAGIRHSERETQVEESQADSQDPSISLHSTRDDGNRATLPEIEGMLSHLKELLDAGDYFREPNREEAMWLNLRTRIISLRSTSQDVQSVRGMIRGCLRKISLHQ